MNQKRVGIIISYINLVMGMVTNVFLTRLLISALGDTDYSLYKVMQSFAGPLAMFHLGLSTIVARSIVRFNSKQNTEKDKQNTMALALLASFIIVAAITIAGVVMCSLIPMIYGEKYVSEDIVTGQKIFMIFVFSSCLHMLTDVFSGCLIGHEKFTISSSLQLFKTIFKLIFLVVLLKLGVGVIAVAVIDLAIGVLTLGGTYLYSRFILHEVPKLYCIDKKQLGEIITFGAAILLQAFVNQVNNNLDTMILGAFVDEKYIITMYSSALSIYCIYNSLISVISNYFLPKATKLISENATGEMLTEFVVAPGRFQAIIAVASVLGFALFGQSFISLWIGERYMEAYWVSLILMIPVTIPLVENAIIAIMDASLKRMFRSVTLVVMAVINLILSIILVNLLGFWGAALGTVASLLIGHILLMNLYYAKTFKINIKRMFCSIFKGILSSGLLAAIICIPLELFLPNSVVFFVMKCILFMIVYLCFLWLWGLNSSEKKTIKDMLKMHSSKIIK